ncbi:MAG: response regulator [Candidatus Margulisbacteria bacterium]|nr:response regulator [Candidatus Margulisiibacteriota bacterium]
MINSLRKYKTLLLTVITFLSPLILLYLLVYGGIVGAIGGVVWGIEKGRNFLFADSREDKSSNNFFFLIIRMVLVAYVFSFICIVAFVICAILGPFKAFAKLRRGWKYLMDGTAFKYNRKKAGRKPLVLVVEDEVDLADYVAGKILTTGKYATVIAHNGKEALRVLEKHERFLGIASNRIGCIVLDIKMPEMNGIQFLQELRRREGVLFFRDSGAFQQIPVIMLSAYEDVQKISDATNPKLGKIARYIMKPEKPEHYDELISAVENVFSGKDQEMVTNAYLSGNYRISELKK